MTQRVLVTGLEGFTGAYLEKALIQKGFEVYGTSLGASTKPSIFTCNITKPDEIATIAQHVKPHYVIHLAGISFVAERNASLIYEVNVLGSEYLLKALTRLKEPPKKVIMASSATVYGNQTCNVLDENLCPHPVNHYGCSKLAMEHLAAGYFKALPILITRPFNYTGPGQEEQFLIPKIIKHFREKCPLIELGNLNVAREFNDVRDVASWYVELLLSPAHSTTVNLCSGEAVSLQSIITTMNALAGYEIEVRVNPEFVRENEIAVLMGSHSRLKALLPHYAYRSIPETLEWMYNV